CACARVAWDSGRAARMGDPGVIRAGGGRARSRHLRNASSRNTVWRILGASWILSLAVFSDSVFGDAGGDLRAARVAPGRDDVGSLRDHASAIGYADRRRV